MRTLPFLLVLITGCAASRAERLRADLRAHALEPTAVDRCRDDSTRCGGYAPTTWGMTPAAVVALTHCELVGVQCTRVATVGGVAATETYVFHDAQLSGVVVDFDRGGEVSYPTAVSLLSRSMGAPLLQHDSRQELEDRANQEHTTEAALALTSAAAGIATRGYWPWYSSHQPATAALESEKALDQQQRCTTWAHEVTRATLCELRQMGRAQTQAVFVSRAHPSGIEVSLGEWAPLR